MRSSWRTSRSDSGGVQFSFTPEWRSEELGGDLLELSRLDMSGSDLTVGFARGRMRSGHWDCLSCANDGTMRRSATIPSASSRPALAWLQGFAANWFLPFGSPFAGDRVQAGMHVDLGGGWLQGTMRVDEVSVDGRAVEQGRSGDNGRRRASGSLEQGSGAALPRRGCGCGDRGAGIEGHRQRRLRAAVHAPVRHQRRLLPHGGPQLRRSGSCHETGGHCRVRRVARSAGARLRADPLVRAGRPRLDGEHSRPRVPATVRIAHAAGPDRHLPRSGIAGRQSDRGRHLQGLPGGPAGVAHALERGRPCGRGGESPRGDESGRREARAWSSSSSYSSCVSSARGRPIASARGTTRRGQSAARTPVGARMRCSGA